jgi:2-methylisocitrate lyase-like PEP mutase family enzyme
MRTRATERLAVERIAAARKAAPKDRFVLTARTDALLQGGTIEDAVRRANLFLKVGADCTFVPGPSDMKTVARLVKEIDGPLNVVIGLDSSKANAHGLIAAGVQRISLGGTIARAALAFIRRSARELRDQGITFADGNCPALTLHVAFANREGPVVRAGRLTTIPHKRGEAERDAG